jgi:hypothetical protein
VVLCQALPSVESLFLHDWMTAIQIGIAKNKILRRGMCDFTGKNDIFVILLRNGTIL